MIANLGGRAVKFFEIENCTYATFIKGVLEFIMLNRD